VTTPLPIPDVPPAQASEILCGPWASPSDVPETFRGRASTNQWLTILLMASELLYQLTGHRWRGSGCTATAEIRSHPYGAGSGTWPFQDIGACGCWLQAPGLSYATNYADAWLFNAAWRGAHPRPLAVDLDVSATAITSVTLGDGTLLDPAAYRLTPAGWLERVDGLGWSGCGEEGPTTVVYERGVNPPVGGITACVQLAMELVKSWCGDQGCAIPPNASTIQRQGITITLDVSKFLQEHRTGIPAVDLWIESVNPRRKNGTRPQRQAAVWSPDLPTATRIAPPA